ncbi:hypothetical protein [Desulfoluna butyratoxydans]|uniref:Uncharacterized protein n=1 Tax=Desulfoluna butyratoxydans TaxID=231438 RepID=A0A4U8YK38_9BACT|nr:hypothetical protein [Desulfoluna butyratoxydans]VFQ43840.1 hypothetical protein MSL71_14810 [Desulfoluna butyratoxydans]
MLDVERDTLRGMERLLRANQLLEQLELLGQRRDLVLEDIILVEKVLKNVAEVIRAFFNENESYFETCLFDISLIASNQ